MSVPASWQLNELTHRYGGCNLYFLDEVNDDYVRLVEFDGKDKPKPTKVWTALRKLVREVETKSNGQSFARPMEEAHRNHITELRDRIAKGEQVFSNGYVVAKPKDKQQC